jgi:hypothetical protein
VRLRTFTNSPTTERQAVFDAETRRRGERRGEELREKGLVHGATPRAATGGSNAEPAEDSARDAALSGAAGFQRIVDHYADFSLTSRVSASSALESGEQGPPDSLILSAFFSASSRLRVEMEVASFPSNSRVRVRYHVFTSWPFSSRCGYGPPVRNSSRMYLSNCGVGSKYPGTRRCARHASSLSSTPMPGVSGT